MKRTETSEAEARFFCAWERAREDNPQLPCLAREWKFHSQRDWRFDFALIEHKLAIELQGLGRGKGGKGRHQTVDGMRKQHEKLNAAAALGWRVMFFLSADKGEALQWVEQVVEVIYYG